MLVKATFGSVAAFNIYQAKTLFSELLRRVRAGEEVVIADAGEPIAKLVPFEAPPVRRVLGADRGKIWIAPDAFAPMSEEELAEFYDAPLFPPTPNVTASQKPKRTGRVSRRKSTR